MRQILAGICAVFLALLPGGGALAGDRLVVVELFTSQGCPYCPPADALLEQLASRDDVMALALHVDYWDYIGWKDTFGSPENTARQRGYADAGDRMIVYTPQMVINGRDHVVGKRLMEVTDIIDRQRAAMREDIAVEVTRGEGRLYIRAEAETPRDMPLIVQLLRYIPRETVEIERGENAGRTMTYTNIVTEMAELAEWDSHTPLDLDVALSGPAPLVILLQYPDFGTIEAVAHLR